MSRFIEEMKSRPYHHQRAFALSVSGGVTLVIFAVWSFVHFGQTKTVATNPEDTNNLAAVVSADQGTNGVTPFQDLKSGIQSSFDTLKAGIEKAKDSIQSTDLNAAYQDSRNQAIDSNGQQ